MPLSDKRALRRRRLDSFRVFGSGDASGPAFPDWCADREYYAAAWHLLLPRASRRLHAEANPSVAPGSPSAQSPRSTAARALRGNDYSSMDTVQISHNAAVADQHLTSAFSARTMLRLDDPIGATSSSMSCFACRKLPWWRGSSLAGYRVGCWASWTGGLVHPRRLDDLDPRRAIAAHRIE
jgi:hypothetical protein